MTEPRRVPILFTDIDGTIRWGKDELGKFVNTKYDVTVFKGVPDLLARYKALGWRIVGISNQGGIGLGHMTQRDCMEAMGETQKQCNYAFDKIVFCAHSPYADCPCRKPKTLMIEDTRHWLFTRHGEVYPKSMSLFVGDRPEDETCAANAGIPFLWAETWHTGMHVHILENS